MPAETSISVSWGAKRALEVIVAEMTSERAKRKEKGRKVSMDDALRRALDDAAEVGQSTEIKNIPI